MKCIAASLVLQGVPWDCIKAVMIIKLQGHPTVPMRAEDITVDIIKDWARQAVQKEPLLLEQATDVQSRVHVTAKRWWLEWSTACWINAQNLKGIPVPSRLVREHYLELWGGGPHTVEAQKHIDGFAFKSMSLKMWLKRYRKRWGFVYTTMPTKAPLTKEQMERKVCMDLTGGPFNFVLGLGFRNRSGTQKWVPVLVPKWLALDGPFQSLLYRTGPLQAPKSGTKSGTQKWGPIGSKNLCRRRFGGNSGGFQLSLTSNDGTASFGERCAVRSKCWQVSWFIIWVSYLNAIGYSLNEATWINIDETPIPYHVQGRAGFRQPHAPVGMGHCFVERATLNQRRAQCTFMAATTNDDELQKELPQVLLPNIVGHKKKWKSSPSLAAAPPHIRVLKDTNGWSTAESMKEYFKLLRAYLKKKGKHKVVLLMDCHPSHYAFSTINYLTKLKWKVVLVPSRLTWLLQPLDKADWRRKWLLAEREAHPASWTLRIGCPSL